MRLALIRAMVFLSMSAQAHASADVSACSASLTSLWHDAAAYHPIDASKHIPVIGIDIPLKSTPTDYRNAVTDLSRTFPSFKEGPGSGILTGCCAFPVFGSISFNDLSALSAAKFEPLCEVGVRNLSAHLQVRIEYRESYESGFGTDPYFFIWF